VSSIARYVCLVSRRVCVMACACVSNKTHVRGTRGVTRQSHGLTKEVD